MALLSKGTWKGIHKGNSSQTTIFDILTILEESSLWSVLHIFCFLLAIKPLVFDGWPQIFLRPIIVLTFSGSFPCTKVAFLCQAATFYKNIFCISFLVVTLLARRLNILSVKLFVKIYVVRHGQREAQDAHVCKTVWGRIQIWTTGVKIIVLVQNLNFAHLSFDVFKADIWNLKKDEHSKLNLKGSYWIFSKSETNVFGFFLPSKK